MSYATQSSVEGVLGRSLTTAEIAALPALLAGVDAYINGETGQVFQTATEATRYYDVERSKMVDVDPFVVAEDKPLRVFYVDADEEPVGDDIDVSDYEARPRNEAVKTWLHRRSGTWGSNCSSKVTNLAVKAFFGFDAVPADIVYAASWLAARQIGGTSSLSLKSESIEGYSRTFADASNSSDGSFLTATFERYREILIG
jgi:hypothetical protein